VGLAVTVVALVGLGLEAVNGDRVVQVQRATLTIRDATLDNAFYHCIDVQALSLVSPGEPVLLGDDLGSVITLLKGVGSWVTIADPASSAVAHLSLRSVASDRGACLGTVVVATYATPHQGPSVRIGSGASVPGHGPPPAPPL